MKDIKEWMQNLVKNPSKDHYLELKISDFDTISRKITNYLKESYDLTPTKSIELFKGMVAGQCANCQGIISGEQILYVGACQQANGYIGSQEFFLKLVKGYCPQCNNSYYNLIWIGENW